jgi:hypothetical protein
MAGADASLAPVVDCVVPLGINATTNKVYFGYTNPGAEVWVPFGDTNQNRARDLVSGPADGLQHGYV